MTTVYVGNDGTSYGAGTDDSCGVIPNDLTDVGAIFDSVTITGNVCVAVPSDKVVGGGWAVTNSRNSAVFIAAV